ncbi:hypothetical protein ACB092_05G222300 [Castanea dentata]
MDSLTGNNVLEEGSIIKTQETRSTSSLQGSSSKNPLLKTTPRTERRHTTRSLIIFFYRDSETMHNYFIGGVN